MGTEMQHTICPRCKFTVEALRSTDGVYRMNRHLAKPGRKRDCKGSGKDVKETFDFDPRSRRGIPRLAPLL